MSNTMVGCPPFAFVWRISNTKRAESGSRRENRVPSGVGYMEGCPVPSRLGVWGSVLSSPSGISDGPPTGNAFWHIEGQLTLLLHLYADALGSSNSVSCHIWGKAEVWGGIYFQHLVLHVPVPLWLSSVMCTGQSWKANRHNQQRTSPVSSV